MVSIIFADLAGSTALHERLDPESVRVFMENYYQAMRRAVDVHEGTLIKFLGDGVMAAFGVPRVAEDDALRSVRAGMAMQDAFAELARQQFDAVGDIGLRVGINTGEVVVSGDNADIVGDPVNITARLQQEANLGDVVIGESTQRLVSSSVTLVPLGRFSLKGRSGVVKAYRVASLDPPAGFASAPFVGREEEIGRITKTCNAAFEEKSVRIALALGSPGLGKSRLIEEFARRLSERATILTAHCNADRGATFVPLVRALRELLQLESHKNAPAIRESVTAALPEGEPDAERIAKGIADFLSGTVASPEETFFVLRRLLGALARTQPVLLVLDDVHWAEPLLLDFIEHMVQWGGGLPLFILLGARPELREVRSSLVTPGGPISEIVTLSGLDANAAMRLAAHTIGASDLPAALAAKVLASSEGNPLYVGELVRMLVQEGAIERQGNRWVAKASLDTIEMPPTIHALLAARIERLPHEELAVLERAAVVGRQFSRGAVAELLSGSVPDLDAHLESLRRAELIERDTGWFLGEPVLRFHHVLIRDAAYRRILKGTRAELHARLASWIESKAENIDELEETLGRHLEQAHRNLTELGPLNDQGREIGKRAAHHLSSAGRRALSRDDVSLAGNLLHRALERLERDDPERADLSLDVCEALLAAGDVARGALAVEDLGRFAGENRRLQAWQVCFEGQLTVLTEPRNLQSTAARVAAAAQELADAGDDAGAAKAHSVHAQALARLGRVGACESALDLALAAARRAGDRRRANTVLAGAPVAALWGPSPVTRASGRCLDVVRVLRITQGAPAVEAVALSCQGVLEALRGRTDAARRMIGSARGMVEELGITHRLFETDVFGSRIDLIEGEAARAELNLRKAFEGLRDLGLGIDAARAGALLGRALLAQDRVDEAEAISQESEHLAGDDLQASIAWRCVRAEAWARRGDSEPAIELAKAAVEIAAATDALLDHADARMALATALRAAGRGPEAQAEEKRATELWEEKGATALVERSRNPEQSEVLAHSEDKAPLVDNLSGAESSPLLADLAPSLRRRQSVNKATKAADQALAALLQRDFEALAQINSERIAIIHHPTGATYGYAELDALNRALWKAIDFKAAQETIATLGDSLVLTHSSFSHQGIEADRLSVGPVTADHTQLYEVDESGQITRLEVFEFERLGLALARLYKRFAERKPEGSERQQAEAIAYTFSVWLQENPLYALEDAPESRWDVSVVDPEFELIDHRAIGMHAIHGPGELDTFLKAVTDFEAATSFHQDLMALDRETLLFKYVKTGTARAGGGSFERRLLVLLQVNSKGKMARTEVFDFEDEAGAFARFDELASGKEPTCRPRRPVRTTAAFRHAERHHAAILAHDPKAIRSHCHPDMKVFYHPTGTPYGTDGLVETWKSAFGAKNLRCEQTTLATLGESLVLVRQLVSHDGLQRGALAEVGPIEVDTFLEMQVDEHEQCVWAEVFAGDRLSDAIARLYERYAEILGEGPTKDRAIGVARSFAVSIGQLDPERIMETLTSSFRCIDHRSLATWGSDSPEAMIEHYQVQIDLASGFAARDEDILALEDQAYLVRRSYFGVARDSGGNFENRVLLLVRFGQDGRADLSEVWDAEQETEALARFDEIMGQSHAPGEAPAELKTFDNTAALADERLMSCFNTRDWEGVLACIAPEVDFDERRRLVRNKAEKEVWLEQFRLMYDLPESRFKIRLLATRGDRLSLHRHEFTSQVADGGGPLEMEPHMTLHEVDEQGRITAIVLFDLENLEEAHAELNSRYEREVGAAGSAWLRMRELHEAIYRRDREGVLATLAPTFHLDDYRKLGWGMTLKNPELFYQSQEAIVDLSPDFRYRIDHFEMGLRAFLIQVNQMGTREGGAFENPYFYLGSLDTEGRFTAFEVYDLDQRDEARARFDAIESSGGSVAEPSLTESSFANAASWACGRLSRLFVEKTDFTGDWKEAFRPLFTPDYVFSDRRKTVLLELGLEETLEFNRSIGEMANRRIHSELIATRGERLALFRLRTEVFDDDVGPSEFCHLNLYEVDEQGLLKAMVRWDEDDLEKAYEELDVRYESGEASAYEEMVALQQSFRRAWPERDLTGMRDSCASDFVRFDHRDLAVLGTVRDPETWIREIHTLVELAPDSVFRADHVRFTAYACLVVGSWDGTHEGGNYEIPMITVMARNDAGELARIDLYDRAHLDMAIKQFRATGSGLHTGGTYADGVAPFENLAVRAGRSGVQYIEANDFDGFRETLAETFRHIDRRKMAQLELDRDQYIEFTLDVDGGRSVRVRVDILATRGERLALLRILAEVEQGDVGPSELEHLNLVEVDAEGRIARQVRFDADDLEAAFGELDARFLVGEGTQWGKRLEFLLRHNEALARRDWAALAGLYDPEIVARDHRLVGWGTLMGQQEFLKSLQEMVALAPDARMIHSHVRMGGRCSLVLSHWEGTRDGGRFESPFIGVSELNDQGLTQRIDFYDPEQIDRALARFEELKPSELLDLRMPPFIDGRASPVLKAWRAWLTALDAGLNGDDWEPVRAITSPDVRFEDRQRWALVSGDREIMIESLRARKAQDARVEASLLGMAADRVAAVRMLWSGGPANGRFEVEYIGLIEIDESGLLTATLLFDADAFHDLQREMWDRWAAIEPSSRELTRVLGQIIDVFQARDPFRVRALLADDYEIRDHRGLSILGGIQGPDEYVTSLNSMWELSREAQAEIGWFWLADEGNLGLTHLSIQGVSNEGGPFEIEMLYLIGVRDGKMERQEMFDVGAMDQALQRFEELKVAEATKSTRQGKAPAATDLPPGVKSNRAARFVENMFTTALRPDWKDDADRAWNLWAPGFVFDDRQRMSRVSGGPELMRESFRARRESGAIPHVQLIGTAGEELALIRMVWTGGPADGRFEIEHLALVELGDRELLSRVILLDMEDLQAAQQEMWDRWAAIDPSCGDLTEAMRGLFAFNTRDREGLWRAMAPDLCVEDHRRTGMGKIEGPEAYLRALEVLWELSESSHVDIGWFWLAQEGNVGLTFLHLTGTNMDGGAFESESLYLVEAENGRVKRLELFEMDAMERALARFDELKSRPSA